MSVKSDRVEARLSPEERERINRAADASGMSLSSFMVAAAVERADAVIAEQSATVVAADYFEELLAALDKPAEQSPRLASAAKLARRQRRIRTA